MGRKESNQTNIHQVPLEMLKNLKICTWFSTAPWEPEEY